MVLDSEKLAKTVAHNIRAERKRAGMSQTDLAKSAGVTHRYVQRIETRPKNLSLNSLLKLSKALGIPITQLLEGAQPARTASKKEIEALRLAVRVIEGYCEASVENA